eukprot:353404-Chlamydomonas_euryale.AAC.11
MMNEEPTNTPMRTCACVGLSPGEGHEDATVCCLDAIARIPAHELRAAMDGCRAAAVAADAEASAAASMTAYGGVGDSGGSWLWSGGAHARGARAHRSGSGSARLGRCAVPPLQHVRWDLPRGVRDATDAVCLGLRPPDLYTVLQGRSAAAGGAGNTHPHAAQLLFVAGAQAPSLVWLGVPLGSPHGALAMLNGLARSLGSAAGAAVGYARSAGGAVVTTPANLASGATRGRRPHLKRCLHAHLSMHGKVDAVGSNSLDAKILLCFFLSLFPSFPFFLHFFLSFCLSFFLPSSFNLTTTYESMDGELQSHLSLSPILCLLTIRRISGQPFVAVCWQAYSSPAFVHTCSPARVHTCSPARIHTCSPAPVHTYSSTLKHTWSSARVYTRPLQAHTSSRPPNRSSHPKPNCCSPPTPNCCSHPTPASHTRMRAGLVGFVSSAVFAPPLSVSRSAAPDAAPLADHSVPPVPPGRGEVAPIVRSLRDPGRALTCLMACPRGRLLAATDSLGRVTLLDGAGMCVMRMWKVRSACSGLLWGSVCRPPQLNTPVGECLQTAATEHSCGGVFADRRN